MTSETSASTSAQNPHGFHPDTLAIRGGMNRTEFHEITEPMFLTQGYAYPDAATAEATFLGETDHYQYSRYGNPTIKTFEQRLAIMDNAESCVATSTGMSAIFSTLAALLKSGDRVVAARELFGSSTQVFDAYFTNWGVTIDYVKATDLEEWEKALATPAKIVFLESPTNPMQDIVDLPGVIALAKKAKALVLVDNVFATPIGQQPLALGADIVIYSATKHIDGQGRVLAGAVLGAKELIDGPIRDFVRQAGTGLAIFNAWVLTKSLETLRLRVEAQAKNALELATWLHQHPKVENCRYPLAPFHPQYELAKSQLSLGGTVVTFDIASPDSDPYSEVTKAAAFRFLDGLNLIDISNNLGDIKSLVTHPATTTHRKIGKTGQEQVGISHKTIRFSVGLEDTRDLQADLAAALAKV